ncbi:hypothetical protein QJS04_geneDACA022303 [Acorus gramineus]|uniref:Uncharacterized protein n=1 Tax=Acorus gramineus TaxID=55184 RepID=A0AAV9B775_ACOGR|nr:hypothetical protein QJS04_geneDACA022303 [Acorus gramineus]
MRAFCSISKSLKRSGDTCLGKDYIQQDLILWPSTHFMAVSSLEVIKDCVPLWRQTDN